MGMLLASPYACMYTGTYIFSCMFAHESIGFFLLTSRDRLMYYMDIDCCIIWTSIILLYIRFECRSRREIAQDEDRLVLYVSMCGIHTHINQARINTHVMSVMRLVVSLLHKMGCASPLQRRRIEKHVLARRCTVLKIITCHKIHMQT
jgi:hypothetical protein